MTSQAKIVEILRRFAKKDIPANPEESLFDTGVLDSFALPDLVCALEEEYSIRIPDADLNTRKFESVARIEAYLAAKS